MINLDTNILLRYIVQDDSGQLSRAAKIIESCTEEEPGFIVNGMVFEFLWALESAYGFSRQEIAEVMDIILTAPELIVEHKECVWSALKAYRTNVDFTDALIGQVGAKYGCTTTKTFDKKAAKNLPQFTLA